RHGAPPPSPTWAVGEPPTPGEGGLKFHWQLSCGVTRFWRGQEGPGQPLPPSRTCLPGHPPGRRRSLHLGGRWGHRGPHLGCPLAAELAGTSSLSSSGAPPASRPSTLALEDLGLLLAEGLASPESLSLEGLPERFESSRLASSTSVPEQDASKRWERLEQWVTDLQAEVACLCQHEDRCERATLGLLRELLQVRAHVQTQGSELWRLQRALEQTARAPEGGSRQLSSAPSQNQIQALDARLVEVREALTDIRRKQALQDSERRSAGQELELRLTKVSGRLEQEEQTREAACGALQKGQEQTSQRVGREVAKMQAQVAQLGEEVSLRFLKREAKLCSFLQRSFLAIEKKMKASESSRAKAESSLWEELESRWRRLQELNEEHMRALQGQQENQLSPSRLLQARDARGNVEKSQADALPSSVRERLEATQQEKQSMLASLREKSLALEASVEELGQQVEGLRGHLLGLSWRLDLHEQTLSLRLSEVKSDWEGAERRSLEDLARWREEAEAHLREIREKVDSLPQQIESISDKCVLHKSDVDLRISAEGKAREFAVGAVRRELAALLASLQHLKEENPSRKVAEIQGRLATFQNQLMRLENSLQDNKVIQKLKFNTEARQRAEELAWRQLCTQPGSRAPGSREGLVSLTRCRCFVKDVVPGPGPPVNRWGLYQAARWLRWKAVLMGLAPPRRPRAVREKPPGQEPAPRLAALPQSQK
ncbi:coiled-coil domain-containing protein 154, partial [Tamandua tetradactyla]|uniref:coiled-coil domain-containing protein 154 n=1 Tax=Tamandua tetradactyla TaxID=48850 RepID=UPI004053829B